GTLMAELQEKTGQAIARLTQNEAAYLSCGAASGITLTMAACMAGTDPIRSERLPNTTGMKNQVVMHVCDQGSECDVALRCDGGADAVIVSGGKGLRGPQSTGLVLGRQWIIDGCAHHGVPNCRLGRGMKVGKEELAGIYAAVKLFMEQDEAEIHAARVRQADD